MIAFIPNPDRDPLITEINDLTRAISLAVDERIVARRTSDRAQAEYQTELLDLYRAERNELTRRLRRRKMVVPRNT